MTERLSTLLHEEAYDVSVPPAPTAAVLVRGRRRRARRRLAGVAGVTAVVAVAATTAVALTGGSSGLDAATPATSEDWAIAQGGTIHLGSGATATVPGQVKSLYYTSAGILVRVGATAATDAPDSNYWLAHDDGSVTDFDLPLGDRVPGTDPTLPYLAYAKAGSDDTHWTVVLRDVRTGEVAASIPIEAAFTWGGWVAPPVALDGDHVWVGVDGTQLDVSWRTGEVRTTTIPTSMPTTRGGHEVVADDQAGTISVVDAVTGESLLALKQSEDAWPRLSPDGRQLLLVPTALCHDGGDCTYEGKPATLYELTTDRSTTISIEYGAYGWTATGEFLILEGNIVKVCSRPGGDCTSRTLDLTSGRVIVSGNSYES